MKTNGKRGGWRYIAEFNRVRGNNIRRTAARLQRCGIREVEKHEHLTTLCMVRPSSMRFDDFKAILKAELQPRIGSLILFSRRTGNAFRCSNKGNRPGEFIKDD